MPNELEAALSYFTPDAKALADARQRRVKKTSSYEQGYREGEKLRQEQARAAEDQLKEQARIDKERAKAEADRADLERKQRLAETEATYRRAGRPTFTDALGEIRPVDDDATFERKQQEKKVAEDLKAQSRADAAFRKSEAVRLNQAETQLKAGLDDYDTAEAIGSQAVSAKASEIITLSQGIKHLSDNAVTEEDQTKLEAMQQRLLAARREKELLENSERTIKVAKLTKEAELKPALGEIQNARDVLPITTAPAIPKGAGVTLQNTVSTAQPAPASADPERAAAILRTQITALRGKGDFTRADALERRLVNPAKWEAEQRAFRQTATPEQLAQTLEAGSADIEQQWQATQQTYAVLSQQRQAYLDRMDRAAAKNATLLDQPYSDGDVAIIRDETTGAETRWHKAAADEFNGALQGLQGWQQANQEKIDLLDLNRQQLQIEAQNLQKHENQLRYLGREQQRQQDGEKATYLNNLRQTPGLAEFADEFERTDTEFTQRKADLERKYPDPVVRDVSRQAMQEDYATRTKNLNERMKARQQEVGTFYRDWGKDIQTDDWQTEASVTPRLQQEAAKRGMSEQDARKVLDTSRKADWSRPLPGDEKGARQLPDGQISVSPSLYLEPKGYEKAVNATEASPAAKKAALAQRRDLAAPMAAQMLLDLQKVPEFAEYLAKTTSGTPVERMEQFQADLREGGALAASLQRFQGGASSLASSALGAVAAITGSDYLRSQGERFQQRAQAFETAGAEGAKGTNAVLGFGSKVIGAAPSMLGAMVPGGLLARLGSVAKLGSVAVNRLALTGAALGSGAQSFGGTYLDAVQAFEKKGLSPTEAHGKALSAALLSGSVTTALTALSGLRGAESFLAEKELVKKTLVARAREIGIGIADEALEEGVDQLAQGIIAQQTYAPDKKLGAILSESLEAALIGGALGGGMTALSETVDHVAGKQALLAEDLAAAESEIENYQDPTTDPAEVEARKSRASLAQAIARGVGLDGIEETILNAAGWTRKDNSGVTRADGSLTKIKDYTGPNVLDVDSDGKVKLDKDYLGRLAKVMPTVASLVGSKQTTWHKPGQIEEAKAPASPAPPLSSSPPPSSPLSPDPAKPAPSAKPSSGEVGPRTPAGTSQTRGTSAQGAAAVTDLDTAGKTQAAAPAVSGAAAAPSVKTVKEVAPDSKEALLPYLPLNKTVDAPRVQRAWEIANHLEMAGLDRASANLIATSEVRARGVSAGGVNGQVTSVPFNEMLNDLGMTGDRTTREGSEPLQLPADGLAKLRSKAASQSTASQNQAKPTTEESSTVAANQKPETRNKKPAPVAPNNPAYPALRAQLAAKEISTVDVLREVVRLSGKHDTGDLQDILTDHLGMKKIAAAAVVETLRAKGELTGAKNDNISLAAGKKASDRQSKPSKEGYTAAKEFVPATQGALAENPAWARAKLAMLARTPPARRRWAYRFLTHLENTISQRAGLYDAFAVGQTARQMLEGQKMAVVPHKDQITLAIDLDRMLADFSYLGDPRAAAIATVMEEDIHAAQFRLMAKGGKWTHASLAQQWRDLPAAIQQAVWKSYHNAHPDKTLPAKPDDATAFHMQSEFLRMLVQGRIDPKSITEAVDASPSLIQSIKDLLADLYDTLRSLIKGLPVSQAVTLDQQVTELKTALEQLGKPSTAEELRTKLFLRDPSALAMQALKNGTIFDHLATQDALFTPQGLARVWDLLTPEMRAQVLRLKKTASPWLSKKRTDNAGLTRDLLTFLLDPRAAEALAQANLTASPTATTSTSMVRRALRAMSDYFRSNRPDFAQTLGSLDLPTAQVLQQMQSLLVNARAQFEAAAAVQKLPALIIAEPQAGDEDTDGPAARSAKAMLAAWMQEAQEKAFLDQAVQLADQILPGVGNALQQRAIARQMAGQTWESLKARMEAAASGSPLPLFPSSPAPAPVLSLPSPAQRSAQAIEEALTDRDNQAQQNTSPQAREAIARRLMQEQWAAAILATAAQAERRYYLNQRELSPEQIRQIDAMQKVATGDLRLDHPYYQREIGTATESGTPVRLMGVTRENDLKALGIRIGSDGTPYAAANAPVYIEGGTIIIKQSTLDDLSQMLPITRRQFRLSEAEQRARVGLTGIPQPVTAEAVAQVRAEQQQAEDDYKARLRLRQLEGQERAAETTSSKPDPLIDPNADPVTGKLQRGERGDLISWLSDHGSLGWPDTKAGGEWDWFLTNLEEYYSTDDKPRTRRKAQRDAAGNVIGFKDITSQNSKLGITNTAKKMARDGNLSTPAAIVEYLIQTGVVTPAVPSKDGSPRNLDLHENLGDRTGLDSIEDQAHTDAYEVTDGIGNAVLDALTAREAARTNRQNDPARAAEIQTLRFERDTRNGPAVVPAHELASLSDDGTTVIHAQNKEGDIVPLTVVSYDWRPVDPDSVEADDFLDGHPAWRETQDGPERLVVTVRNGTHYGQQQIAGDTILRVHDTGNTGLGVDLGDGKGDFVTEEAAEDEESVRLGDEEPQTLPVSQSAAEPDLDSALADLEAALQEDMLDQLIEEGEAPLASSERQILRTDEHGKSIVWENDNYFIAVNDPEDATYLSLWHKKEPNPVKKGNLKITPGREPNTRGFAVVDESYIFTDHRGQGLGLELYRQAIRYISPKFKGLASENSQRANTTQVPRIWKKLRAQETDGDFTLPLPASIRTTPEQRRDELTSAEVDVQGTRVRTGTPVTFRFLHNKKSATKIWGKPKKDSDFDRGYEPSGRYVSEVNDSDYLLKNFPGQYDAGELTFKNPIVIAGGTYGEPTSWKRRLSTLYGGTRGKRLSQAILADGYDGIITVSDHGNPSEILDLTTFDAGKALYAAPRLQALHNLSAENLIFADKMGGIAVPSMAVTPEGQGMSGFGNITLIGTRNLVDPSKEPVFDADAYSPRFPDPEFPKAKSKDAQKVVDDIRPFAKAFGENSLTDSIWDNAVNRPRPGDTVEKMQRSDAAKAAFLASQGIQVQPVMKDTSIYYDVIREPAFQPFRENPQQWFQTDYNDSAAMQRLGTLVKNAELQKIDKLDVSRKIKDYLRKNAAEQLNEKGELLYGVWDRIGRDLKNLGTQTVDYEATRKVIAEAMQGKEAALKAWAEKLILPLHDAPSLTLRGRKVPYTLDNIVQAMTGRVRGREDTLAFGEGAARAHISKRFKDLEQMRKAAGEQIVPEAEVNAARERAQKVLAQYREQVADYTTITNYRGNKDHFAAFDAAMRALITWAKGKKDAATLARALRAEDFENVPDNVVQLGQRAAQLWLQAPVPYFEAKPQRAVGLNEFIGAVIPEGSPPEVTQILDKHGIRHRTYTGSTDAQTAVAAEFAQQLSAEGLPALFSASRTRRDATFDPGIQTPFGTLLQYSWMHRAEDVWNPRTGEVEQQRVSDWDKALTNAETGREIVHHFSVKRPDGQALFASARHNFSPELVEEARAEMKENTTDPDYKGGNAWMTPAGRWINLGDGAHYEASGIVYDHGYGPAMAAGYVRVTMGGNQMFAEFFGPLTPRLKRQVSDGAIEQQIAAQNIIFEPFAEKHYGKSKYNEETGQSLFAADRFDNPLERAQAIRDGTRRRWKEEYPDESPLDAGAWWIDRSGTKSSSESTAETSEQLTLFASPKLRAAADTAARAARASGIVSYDDFRALIAAKLPQALTTLDPILPEVWDQSAQPRLALDLPEASPQSPPLPVSKSPRSVSKSPRLAQQSLPFQPRAPTIERTSAPLPPGAKATPLDSAQWDADQREQRRLAEQADNPEDSFDDELGRAADEALGPDFDEDGTPLPASDKSTPESIAPTLDLRYTTPDGQDPESTRRNPLESDQGPGPGTDGSGPRRLPAQASDMLAWAKENGWLIDTDDLAQRVGLMQEVTPGDEHDVWFDELTQRAVKLTKDLNGTPAFVAGSPAAYLTNLRIQNTQFDTGFAFEGVVDDNGTPRFVTSQPWITGTPATQQAKEAYFKAKGFDPAAQDTFYSIGQDLLVTDARNVNVYQREDGTVQPIDLQVRAVAPRQSEMWENRVAAYGLASSDRNQPYTAAIEKAGIRPAISVNGKPYTGNPGMWHPEILAHYVWKNVYTPQQRRDDPYQVKAGKFALEEWMDSRGSGFDDFGFLTNEGKFIDREEAFEYITKRGLKLPEDSYSQRYRSLDSSDLLNLGASDRILAAAAKTNTTPSEAQIEAENYQTGKVTVHGLRLSIENPRGSVRRGTDANGKAWEITMPHHYGRILGTTGADKDHVDFFLGPDPTSPMAFVINQKKPGNGHFDEHKVMLGFTHPGTAARGYLDSYSPGWRGYSSIVPMTLPQLKHWLEHGKLGEAVTKAPVVSNDTKPLASTDKSARETLGMGVSYRDGKSRIIQGLAQINRDRRTTIGLVSGESEEPQIYTRAGGSIPSYTERADVNDLFAEEARLIARAKAEGFFWDKAQVDHLLAGLPHKGGGTEHDVYLIKGSAPIVIRSTILDSYGYPGRSPAQYLKRLADYNRLFPGIQTRMIGVSLNARGSGVIWTAQPFVLAREPKDSELQQAMEARGWQRIDKDYDENIIYRHTETGVVIRDAHSGNILIHGQELYPIDVIVTDLGTLSASPRSQSPSLPLSASPRLLDQASRASFNHLDRWFTGALARQAAKVTSSDPVTAATQAASAWWNQDTPGVSTLRSLKELAQRELLPETVLPREIMSAMREMQIKQSMGQQKALDVGRALSDKPKFSDLHYPPEFVENPMHREQMFSAMEQGKVDTLPPALQEVAKKLRQMLVEAGREAVKQGRMNPDTFEGLRTNFMPRFTKEEAQASAGDFAKRFKLGVKDILAQRSTAFHITDTSRKDKTGLPQIVSHAKGKWRFDSQQARDAYYEDLINRQTLDGELARNDMHWMNRGDARALRSITPEMLKAPATMTKDQRDVVARVQRQLRNQFKKEDPYEPKDLVKDPAYAVMRYLAQMTHDNAVAEFFNIIEANPDWTSTTELKGFKKIDDNDRFGALAGKYVRKDIADQVMELAHTPAQVIQLYDTLLRLWKTGKTVLNPATHARNIIGNLPFAQFAGNNLLNPANWTHYAHALRTLREGGDEYRQLYETGVLGADYASTELRAALENIVPVVQEDDSTSPIRHLIALGNRAAQWGKAHSLANVATLGSVGATAGFIAAGPLGALAGAGIAAAANPLYRAALWAYRLEDDLFKAAAFFKARSMGMTKEQAAQHVRDWFPYYDKPTSTTLKFAGRTTMPFLSFFRESARIGAKAAKERPLSLAATLAIPTIITALSQAALGLDDEDMEDVKAGMRGKGAKLLGMTPLAGVPIFSMLIPWRTSSGQLQQIDLSSTHPMADFLANRVENWNNDPWWQAWSRSALANPMLGALYTAATGRDPFGDRTLWDSSYISDEKAKAILGHAWKTAMPPLAPGGTNWTMIEQSTRRQANKTLALRSPAQAVGRGVLGVDVRSADPDIYALADAFRKRRGLPVTEGNVAYPTDAAGRARKALFEELVQPQPSPAALAKLLQTLNDLGKPVRTVADVLDILDYRRPDGVINPKELRAPFRASLAPEARRVLDTALREFQKARAATPGAFAKARLQIKPTTRAPITEP